ncbi:ATP-binding cassette domain-containing protein, partial [Halolamina salina]|uniref:ATP-binding cassette domain-containing protein n=1 Tax=Halolamina salina TaxID=1220023 RepID=UPI00361EB30B
MSNEHTPTTGERAAERADASVDDDAETVLELSNVAKEFAGERAVDGVDLAVREGELLVLVGPSGCGKSTTLRTIAGLE